MIDQFVTAAAAAPWDSAAQVKMVLALLLLSDELDGEPVPIGGSAWWDRTGLSEARIRRAKHALRRAGVMTLVGEANPKTHMPQRWRFQPNPRRWGRFAPGDYYPLPPFSGGPFTYDTPSGPYHHLRPFRPESKPREAKAEDPVQVFLSRLEIVCKACRMAAALPIPGDLPPSRIVEMGGSLVGAITDLETLRWRIRPAVAPPTTTGGTTQRRPAPPGPAARPRAPTRR